MNGKSYFDHLLILWDRSEKFGLSVRSIHCGICQHLIENSAIRIENEVYLFCPNGHLVGNDKEPSEAKVLFLHLCAENNPQLIRDYEDLLQCIKESIKPLSDLQE